MIKRLLSVPRAKFPIHHHARCLSTGVDKIPPKLNEINSTLLTIEQTTKPKAKSPYDQLKFGKEFSDHLLEIDWSNDYGWHDPVIKPYGSFQLDPAASVLHYALEAFEGAPNFPLCDTTKPHPISPHNITRNEGVH